MLFGSGYWFVKAASSEEGVVVDNKKYTVELSKKNVHKRDIDQEEGIIPPAIFKESKVTPNASSKYLPI